MENLLWFRAPEKVYFKKGCMPVALDELGTVLNKKKAFIITDNFLYQNGNVKPVEDNLNAMSIQHTCFCVNGSTIESVTAGANSAKLFEPDVIIAVGGGAVIDAAKLIWVLYENNDADLNALANEYNDISNKPDTFPRTGNKTFFVAVATAAGTASEVSPYAVFADAEGNTKLIADYQLLPNMAIVDADNMMNQPQTVTAEGGMAVLANALEAYTSPMATEYSDGMALEAVKYVFDYLPSAYKNGAGDPIAREKMANASANAGLALANAYDSAVRVAADKLSAEQNISYNAACAAVLTDVIRNKANAVSRYAECARFAGAAGNNDEELVANLIKKIDELKAEIGLA